METLKQSIPVASAPERVWEAVVDFEARPRWSPRVKMAQVLGGGPLREGSRIALQIDGNRLTPTVIEMRRPERLVLEVRGPGFRGVHVYEVHTAGDHTTLTLAAQYGGVLGLLMGRFMRGSVRRDLADELAAIKRAAEAG
ncbi:MAG: SRPBCC family protein [Chloroflexi bacterium]|nr:SRPBCC family protein [Chloroflexota bacterium]